MNGGSKLEVILLHKDQQIGSFVLAERQLGGRQLDEWQLGGRQFGVQQLGVRQLDGGKFGGQQLGGGEQGSKPEFELVEFGNSLHLGRSRFVLQLKNFGRIVEIV